MYSDYGIVFDGTGSWNFGNDFARNVVIFIVDNSSSSHADNSKNTLLVLGERPTSGINGSFDSPEKKFSINFSDRKFCFSLHYNCDTSCLFLNGKVVFKFKANNKNINFPSQFFLGSMANEFGCY